MLNLYWNPWALPALVATVVTGTLAAFVYGARPDRTQNQRLALQMGVEAFVMFSLQGGTWIMADASFVYAMAGVGIMFVWIKLWTYYNFLATLPTPLARRLERPRVRWGLLVVILLLAATWFLEPTFYVRGVRPTPFAEQAHLPGTGWTFILLIWAFVWLVSLVFAISAYRRAPTAILRRQAWWYLLSFGVRDVGFALLAVLLVAVPREHPAWLILFISMAGLWIVYPVMVAYAILRTQLFEIELTIKWTLEKSTIAAVFGAVFVTVGELVELILELDGTLYGLLAAVSVGLFVRRIEIGAERVADRAMPGVEDTPDYREDRKKEIYRAQLEQLMTDQQITAKERKALLQLQDDLGLEGEVANRLEREVLEALSAQA